MPARYIVDVEELRDREGFVVSLRKINIDPQGYLIASHSGHRLASLLGKISKRIQDEEEQKKERDPIEEHHDGSPPEPDCDCSFCNQKRIRFIGVVKAMFLEATKDPEEQQKERSPIDHQARATIKVAEAAAIAGCGERAIREGIRSGKIPHLKTGRNILIPRFAFLKWIESGKGMD